MFWYMGDDTIMLIPQLDNLVVSNGSFNATRLSNDVITSTGDVFTLIGYAILAAIIVGILYAIYVLLGGS